MSTDTHTEILACEASHDCYHKACRDCGRPMRNTKHNKADHPGTRTHQRGGSCSTCCWGKVRLIPADLKDQRHMLLSDHEMDRIQRDDPGLYDWCIKRRKSLYKQELDRIRRTNERITPETQRFLTLLTSRA